MPSDLNYDDMLVTNIINSSEDSPINSVPNYVNNVDVESVRELFNSSSEVLTESFVNIYNARKILVALSNEEFYCDYDREQWESNFKDVLGLLEKYDALLTSPSRLKLVRQTSSPGTTPPPPPRPSPIKRVINKIRRRLGL